MTKIIKITLCCLIMFSVSTIKSQETLNANDPSSFVLGGGQNVNPINISLSEFAIVDVEPDPDNSISFGGINSSLEAGLSALSGNASVNEELWVNFSIRTNTNTSNTTLSVRANQNLPNGMVITIQVINVNVNSSDIQNPSQIYDLRTVSVDANFKDLVKDIKGGGVSGDGVNNGFQLRITINNPNMLSLPNGFALEYELN
ncbi:hypothetical protein Q4553_03730 [Tenacibaculum soleae]|uniref:hypothetical protein n=1 Tax=Tenacibaculum soleae TaxID=447689 RepID=UPI0026E3896F|nr:hypothetical protein [Tenacibaculum soleae]MDO6743669.1 hypothetical protein [Tenacibaculum soleae]